MSKKKGKRKNSKGSTQPKTKPKSKPLGKVLHIVGEEAIVKNPQRMPKSGNVALLENRVVGTVRHPFGRVDEPYIPVKLNQLGSKLGDKLVGSELSFAYRPRKRK